MSEEFLEAEDIINLLNSRLKKFNSKIVCQIAGQNYTFIEVLKEADLGEFEFVFEKKSSKDKLFSMSVFPSRSVIERFIQRMPVLEILKDHTYYIDLE